MKYIVEFEDEPCMYEDDVHFYKCVQAPWWGLSERVIEQLTPYQPEPDCVSRKTALDAFGLSEKTRKYGGDHSGYDTRMLYEIQDTLENLPAVQPDHIADIGKKVADEDCISRQMAIDAVSEYATIWMSYTDDMSASDIAQEAINSAKDTMIRILKNQPNVQPEIIRCKDCKHYLHDEEYGFDWCNRMSGVFRAKPDGFCSWAVMRGGDSDE